MRYALGATMLAMALAWTGPAAAETHAWGWRGDGTGRFPDADPPLRWGRISATIKGLRNSADRLPEGALAKAKTMEQGTISEWLILGPVAADSEAIVKDLVEKEQIQGEALLQPKDGDKVGDVSWRKIEATASMLFFNQHIDGLKDQVVYACAYLHSPQARRVLLHLGMAAGKVWVNGETHVSQSGFTQSNSTLTAQLKEGWNTVLVKTFCARQDTDYGGTKAGDAYVKLTLYGAEKGETFETENILWRARPPQAGVGGTQHFSCYQPIVVGDKLFVASDPGFLVCYDKNTGEQLWMRDTTAYDFVTDEERKANPELFVKIDADQKKFREIAYSYKGTLQEVAELYGLNDGIRNSLKKVNAEKYHYDTHQEAGNADQPVSDGSFVYVWYHNNVAACFDLDGKQIWKAYEYDEGPHERHGYKKAPMLIGSEFAIEVKKNIIGFDRKTGKVNWRIPFTFNTYSNYNIDDREKSDQTDIASFRDLGLHKPGVGFVPWSATTRAGDRLYGGGNESGVLVRLQMTKEGETTFEIKQVRQPGGGPGRKILTPGTNWSPAIGAANFLVHEGLLYSIGFGGVLRVFDAETLQLVYERQLDFVPVTYAYPYPYGAGVCASPTLGGKHVYLWGATGTTIVIEPGREFKQVAMNRIESALEGDLYKWHDHFRADQYYPECTVSSPIFDGNRIYYRAEGYVNCIGGGKAAPAAKPKAGPAAAAPAVKPAAAAQAASPDGARAAEIYRSARDAERQGMKDLARQLYAKVVEGYPESSAAESARERLGALR